MDHDANDANDPAQDTAARVRNLRASIAALSGALGRETERRRYYEDPRTFSLVALRGIRERIRALNGRLADARRELEELTRSDGADDRCGARCRDGHACRAPGNGRGGRCKLHGGRSSGPRTAEGRARSLAALRRATQARAAT